MADYLNWKEINITDFSDENICSLYNEGYVFARKGRGTMVQTRSMRIDLTKFELSSENRRVLRKTKNIELKIHPLPCIDYHWSVGKLGKDFYDTKFGKGTFSANKIKELMTDPEKSNFDTVLIYSQNKTEIGFCISKQTDQIFHYSYPFYNLEKNEANIGMGMMIKAIIYAKEQNKKYIYIGSAQRPGDKYKLQFSGLEWFNGEEWTDDLEKLKKLLKYDQ